MEVNIRMIKLKNIKFINLAGGVSCLGALVIAFFAATPPVFEAVKAEENNTAVTAVNANVASVVSVALQNKIDVDIVPKSGGSTQTGDAILTISTNNRSGYSILMTTADGTSNLKNTKSDLSDNVIAPIAEKISLKNAANNTWGYNLTKGVVASSNETEFSGVPKNNQNIWSADEGSDADKYTLSFGTKVDTTIPSGTYNNTVIVSAIAKPSQVTELSELIYMQDMTHEICANSPVEPAEGSTRQLIDTRDGKLYYVIKMKDNNCWMAQNLDLDLTPTVIANNGLNSSNTDLGYTGTGQLATANGTVWSTVVSANSTTDGSTSCPTGTLVSEGGNCQVVYGKARYLPNRTIEVSENNQLEKLADVSNVVRTNTLSWDVGKWLRAFPLQGGSCDGSTWMGGCAQNGFLDVSDEAKWSPSFMATWRTGINDDGEEFKRFEAYKCTMGFGTVHGVEKTCLGGEYDPHYLMGNYYQWNTVTAGTGGTIATGTNATSSICPKGWRLPNGEFTGAYPRQHAQFLPGSYSYMLRTYGFDMDSTEHGWTGYGGPSELESGLNVRLAPFYGYLSGIISEDGVINYAGYWGMLWASTKGSSDYMASAIAYGSAESYPVNFRPTNEGASVRCIAR